MMRNWLRVSLVRYAVLDRLAAVQWAAALQVVAQLGSRCLDTVGQDIDLGIGLVVDQDNIDQGVGFGVEQGVGLGVGQDVGHVVVQGIGLGVD